VDHKSVAQRVLKDVGGAGNIVAAAHCATRLRLVLKNQDKVDQAAIDNDEDLKGSFLNAGQFQIIVGPGDVNEVHKHLIAAGAPEASKDELKEIASKQGNIVSRFIKTIADIFVPLIPVLVGGGMLMALNSLLTSKGIFGPQAVIELFPEWADFADIVNLLSAAPFAFLPVLVGFSATKVFGGNPYLGMTMGAAMVSPALMNGYNVAASLAGADGIDPMKYWNLFGLQVQQAGYQGTVLPIMLVAFILSHIEKFFHKVLKGTIDFIFTPTLTILITGFPSSPPLQRAVTGGSQVIVTGRNLIRGFSFPRAALPASYTIRSAIDLVPPMIALLVLVVVLPPHAWPSWHWVLIVPVLALQVLLSLGLTLAASRITTTIPDMRNIWPFLTQFWFYASGVFFSYERFINHPVMLRAMDLNPGYLIITMYRDVILYQRVPQPRMWLILSAWSLGLTAVSFVFFWEKEEAYGVER